MNHLSNLKSTFVIDIDGTMVGESSHEEDVKVLPGVLEKLSLWISQGHYIVVMTARKESLREKTVKQLADFGIVYDQLVMGVTSGKRILINDKKPYCPHEDTALCVNLVRNEGMKSVNFV